MYWTHTDVGGHGRVRYYTDFGVRPAGHHPGRPPLPLTPDMVGVDPNNCSGYVVYNWYSKDLAVLRPSQDMALSYENTVYGIVSPVTQGWAFIGEVDKFVTAAAIRFPAVQCSMQTGCSVLVTGVANETVRVCAAKCGDVTTPSKRGSVAPKLVCRTVFFERSTTLPVQLL